MLQESRRGVPSGRLAIGLGSRESTRVIQSESKWYTKNGIIWIIWIWDDGTIAPIHFPTEWKDPSRFSSFDISELCCRQIRWNLWMTWVEWWWFQSCRADWSGLAHAAFGPKVGDSKWTSSEIGWELKSKSLKIQSQRLTSPNWNNSRCCENIFLRRRNWWSSSWL